MRSVGRIALVFGMLLLVLAVIAFVLENQQGVSLLFLGWIAPQLPLSVVVVITLLIGILIGPVVAWFGRRLLRGRHKRLT